MIKLIIESLGTVSEQAQITGIAAVPRISRNGNLYTKTELERADGVRVPLNWEHNSDKVIGHATFRYNPELEQLFYEATVTDESTAALVRNKKLFTSIEADVRDVQQICNGPRDCFAMPVGLEFRALALTEMPGIPETTVTVTEKFIGLPPHTCPADSSLVHNASKAESMTSEDKPCNCKESKTKEQECGPDQMWDADAQKCVPKSGGSGDSGKDEEKKENLGGGPDDQAAGVDQKKPGEVPCGDGMKLDGDGKCVPADNDGPGASDGPTVESRGWAPNQDELRKEIAKVTSTLEKLQSKVEDSVKPVDASKAREDFNKNLYSVTKLSPTGNGFARDDINFIAQEGWSQLKKFGSYNFDVDLSNQWVNENFKRTRIEEAISFSGDQSNKVAVTDDVFVLPGGKYLKPIRDLVRFDEIPEGTDQIKRFKGDIPNASTITEGSTNTAATHTATTVTLSADDVTGVPQSIKKSDIEDSPFRAFDYLAQTARAEVLDHEATLVFDTTAEAATPGLTINSGGTGAFDVDYFTEALEYYEDQGYDTSFGNIFCAVQPKVMREIRDSTKIERFLQQGDAQQTRNGRITHLQGIEIVPMNATNKTTNNKAIFGVKGHTFWLASKRELTIDMLKIPNESAFDWMWTQRKNAAVFDPASFVEARSAL